MPVSEEVRLVIKETSRETVREALKEFAVTQAKDLALHEAKCPGRRVGKGFVTVITVAVGLIVVSLLKALGALWLWFQAQGK